MNDRVAGPGELTCIDRNCPVSGLRQAEGRSACPECGTDLARMPSDVAEEAPIARTPRAAGVPLGLAGTSGARSGWQSRSPLFRIGVALAVGALVWFLSFVIRNPDVMHRVTGAGYAVGDCVHVGQSLSGSTMKKTDCASSGSAVLGDPVYRVDAVEKGKQAYCPGGGFDHVTFSNEPENMTYCLVMQ